MLGFSGGGGLGGGNPNFKINLAKVMASEKDIGLEVVAVLEHQTSHNGPSFAPFVWTIESMGDGTAGIAQSFALLLMAWSGTDSRVYVHVCNAQRFDQLDDLDHGQLSPPEWTTTSPAMASYTWQLSDWSYIVLWKGTDEAHHLYESGAGGTDLALLSTRLSWTDCSEFEPAIIHHPNRPLTGDHWIYAWAGTDKPTHSLNVATRADLVDRHVPVDEWYKEYHAV
jgi:hypothetical protein